MKCRVSTSFRPNNKFPSSRDKTQERQPAAAVAESQRKAGNSVTIQQTTDTRRQPITQRACFACRLQHVIFSCRLARSQSDGKQDACSKWPGKKLTGCFQILAKSLISGHPPHFFHYFLFILFLFFYINNYFK